MHQARPYGLHVIGLPITDKDEAFISSVAVRITNLKNVSGVDSMKMVYDLPDGGYVIVQDVGGNFRVIAHKPIIKDDPIIFDGIATDYVPMLYSGIITKWIVPKSQGAGLKITEEARHRLRGYDPLNPMPPKDIDLHRFRIKYNDRFYEFKPNIESNNVRTQYTALRPTWYSGAIAEVMQIVGGYGRQDIANLPDNTLERAVTSLPLIVANEVRREIENLRLPAYTGIPPVDGSFQYDYKFNSTNGISFDADNKPWLIRVSSIGVWAMPLPMIPATTTKAFKQYIQDVDDKEILAIIERFGGMPSGETFPDGKAFQAWRRAGAIIKVCDSSDFYSHIAYSSACGWSFNSNGNEGYNTCYDYYDDEGLGYGLTYKLRLRLAPADNHLGEIAEDINNVMLPEKATSVRKYLNTLIPELQIGSPETNAIFYKLRRVGLNVIYERSLLTNGSMDIDYWNNLELEPIAKHQGKISEVYRGYLYHGAIFKYQPQIKFPEPLLGACLSHDFLPLMNGRYKDKYPNSDTIMFAYYIGDSLKTVKFFMDWGKFKQDSVDNFEPNMIVGKWEKVETFGETSIQGYFYSSDIDDRDITPESKHHTVIAGEDKGFDTRPRYGFDDLFSKTGTMFRYRYYTQKTNIEIEGNRQISLAVCIPYFCRNAVIHAFYDNLSSRTSSESLALGWVQDPTSYRFWTFHPVYAWSGGGLKTTNGRPLPINGAPVWVEELEYKPLPANEFADNGDWVGGLPADYTWLIGPGIGQADAGASGTKPTVKEYNTSTTATNIEKGRVSLSMGVVPNVIHNNIPEPDYYLGSPNDLGDFFYKGGSHILFGETLYYRVTEPSKGSASTHWGDSMLVDHKNNYQFIGVINE